MGGVIVQYSCSREHVVLLFPLPSVPPDLPPSLSPSQFVQTELHEGSEKSQKFHETDLEITFEDLWHSWRENEGKRSQFH